MEGERGVVVLEEGSGWEGEEWLKYHWSGRGVRWNAVRYECNAMLASEANSSIFHVFSHVFRIT